MDWPQAAAIAAEQGPAAAAAVLAAAPDAGDTRYLMVLRRLVDADPAAWTTAPAEILAALGLPELRAFYLAVAADQARHPDAFPGTALAEAAAAALIMHRDLPAEDSTAADTTDDDPAAVYLAEALLDLLTAAWRADADLGDDLPAALDHLYSLTAP